MIFDYQNASFVDAGRSWLEVWVEPERSPCVPYESGISALIRVAETGVQVAQL